MRKLRLIRRAEEMDVIDASIYGGNGVVTLPGWSGTVIWGSDEDGWEHVSVSPFDHSITPAWDDMCRIKDIFFEDEEVAIQFHPPKSAYVNMMENCLHLWRPLEPELQKKLGEAGDGKR